MSVRSHIRSNVVGYVALFVALSGTAWAATELGKNDVKSKHIGKGQVKNTDLGDGSVTSAKVADGSLFSEDFATGELSGGPEGPEGPEGPPGPPGSPDTPQQVLDKIKQVDGSGSGLDADLLDGASSGTFGGVRWGRIDLPAPMPSGTNTQLGFLPVPGLGRINVDCGHNSQNPPAVRVSFENTSSGPVDLIQFAGSNLDAVVLTRSAFPTEEVSLVGPADVPVVTMVMIMERTASPRQAIVSSYSWPDADSCLVGGQVEFTP